VLLPLPHCGRGALGSPSCHGFGEPPALWVWWVGAQPWGGSLGSPQPSARCPQRAQSIVPSPRLARCLAAGAGTGAWLGSGFTPRPPRAADSALNLRISSKRRREGAPGRVSSSTSPSRALRALGWVPRASLAVGRWCREGEMGARQLGDRVPGPPRLHRGAQPGGLPAVPWGAAGARSPPCRYGAGSGGAMALCTPSRGPVAQALCFPFLESLDQGKKMYFWSFLRFSLRVYFFFPPSLF